MGTTNETQKILFPQFKKKKNIYYVFDWERHRRIFLKP